VSERIAIGPLLMAAAALFFLSSAPTNGRAQVVANDSTVTKERNAFAKLKLAMLLDDRAAVAAMGIYPLVVIKGVSGRVNVPSAARLVQWYDLVITKRVRDAVAKQNTDSLRLIGQALGTRDGELVIGTRCDDGRKKCAVGIVAINLFSVSAK
jgi:hypothetical protein